MKKAPSSLVIKSLPASVKGRSLSAAKRDAIVKKWRGDTPVKTIRKLSSEHTATGSGQVSFSSNPRAA